MGELIQINGAETFSEAAMPLGDLAIVSFDQSDGAPASIGFITEGGCCSSSNKNCEI